MASEIPCPFCRKATAKSQMAPAPSGMMNPDVVIQCPTCGEYQINERVDLHDVQRKVHPESHIIRGIIWERNEQNEVAVLSTELLANPRNFTIVPETPMDKMERLLLYFGNKSDYFGQGVNYPVLEKGQAIAFAKNGEEFKSIVQFMEEQAKLILHGAKGVVLTFEGWQRFQELKKARPDSTQAFVAMSFDPALDEAYEKGIKPALAANGYGPFRMKEIQHDGKICDRILAEIRRSRLVVADFTHQRGGVYYEAGFAQGLGIPVVRSCREDEKDKLHFDTRQYNHLLWKTADDLQKQLSDRLAALYALKPAVAASRRK